MPVAEANVLTRRADSGSVRLDSAQYGDVLYAAMPKRQEPVGWVIISFRYDETMPSPGYASQKEREEIEASWNRFLRLPTVDWQRVESLTTTANPASTRTTLPKASMHRTTRPAREITLAEARELALEVLRDAKRDIEHERAQEGQFLMTLFEDDDI
jgi:hypothetical protein